MPLMAPTSEYTEHNAKRREISNGNQCKQQTRNISQGPVAILWDIENCPVPSDTRPEDVAGNIRMALRVHPVIDGAVTMFSAFGDFNAFPRRVREGCQRTGVKLIDVPNGQKDAADKAILIDMFLFALDNPPPSSIMLISGDVDFAPALHILGQRGYTVILVIPSSVWVSSALSNAGRFVWDWTSVARGEGFVPSAKAFQPPRSGSGEGAGLLMGYQMNGIRDGQNEEESIVYKGVSRSCYNGKDGLFVSQSQPVNNNGSSSVPQIPANARSHGISAGLREVSSKPLASCEQNDLSWVQPGDLSGLKGQLVKLLELSGGSLLLPCLPAEYKKVYGRPLYVSEYGASKLVNLLKKMADALVVEGKGQRKFICLRNVKCGQVGDPVILARRDKKEKGAHEGCIDGVAGAGSSDEFSDNERMIAEGEKSIMEMTSVSERLESFKYELEEILVSYCCRICVADFEVIYEHRYKKQLDYARFGVNNLEELLEKVRDVVVLQEEPVSRKKFMIVVGGVQ